MIGAGSTSSSSWGDKGVGKTSLITRFVTQQFDPDIKSTVGVDHFSTTIKLGKDSVKTQIWDTAGQERFRSMTKVYFRNAPGAIVVYDISNPGSFQNVTHWVSEIRQHARSDAVILLVGNKDGPPRGAGP